MCKLSRALLPDSRYKITFHKYFGFVSFTVNILNNLTQQPYSFPDIHTDPKDTAKRTTLQPKITL